MSTCKMGLRSASRLARGTAEGNQTSYSQQESLINSQKRGGCMPSHHPAPPKDPATGPQPLAGVHDEQTEVRTSSAKRIFCRAFSTNLRHTHMPLVTELRRGPRALKRTGSRSSCGVDGDHPPRRRTGGRSSSGLWCAVGDQ